MHTSTMKLVSAAIALTFIVFATGISSGIPIIHAQAAQNSSDVENPAALEAIPGLPPHDESPSSLEATSGLTPIVEDEEHPEVERDAPISWEGEEEVGDDEEGLRTEDPEMQTFETFSTTSSGPALGPNLVPNADLESSTASGLPTSWFKGGYGTNNRVLTYPVAGVGGNKAMQVTISSYTSGDAKWFSDEISVTPGTTYQISDFVKSTVPSIITLRFKKSDGAFIYRDVLLTGAHADFTKVEATFTVPSGTVSLSIFHLIKEAGTLTTDNYSLNEVIEDTGDGNLMPNAGLEMDTGSGLPTSWFKGGYGTNNRAFTYPVAGVGGSKAARVEISNYTSGDAKWYHEAIPVSSGTYTFRDNYKSDVPSIVTVQFEKSGGGFSYLDIAQLPASPGSFSETAVDFTVPSGVVSLTIFHLIKTNGSLTIDSTGLFKKDVPQTVFESGAVSLTFDDGWDAHHDIVMPKLNSAGMHGTFYIVSERFDEDGFPAFMTRAQVQNIRNNGHEIGAHTKTHRDLTTLNTTERHAEIEGSKQDLENMGLGPITTFAYPFGAYNTSILEIVKNTPYEAARATINGNVTPSSDRYQLERFSVESHTTLASVQNAVDNAIANNEWLILTFHRIDNSGLRYSTTPETFRAIVDYVESKNILVPTVAEGVGGL